MSVRAAGGVPCLPLQMALCGQVIKSESPMRWFFRRHGEAKPLGSAPELQYTTILQSYVTFRVQDRYTCHKEVFSEVILPYVEQIPLMDINTDTYGTAKGIGIMFRCSRNPLFVQPYRAELSACGAAPQDHLYLVT